MARIDDLEDSIDQVLAAALRSRGRVGLAVGVVAGDEERVLAAGRAGPGAGRAPDAATLFEIGSITKVFTALALADLAERGVVGLDDPVRAHLPPSVTVPSANGREITLADLATHTSGLPRLPRGIPWFRDRNRPGGPYARYTVEDLYAALARTKLKRRPGEKFRYSNFGGGLLGNALARAAGLGYEELLVERICAPLGMADTRITLAPEQRARLAQGHSFLRARAVSAWELPALAGAGALRSTPADMLRFLRANLGGAPAALASAVELTHQPRVRVGRRAQVGLGWLLAPLGRREVTMLWHNGGTGGFRSFAGVVEATGTAVVVLGNSARSVDRLGLRLLELLQPAGG